MITIEHILVLRKNEEKKQELSLASECDERASSMRMGLSVVINLGISPCRPSRLLPSCGIISPLSNAPVCRPPFLLDSMMPERRSYAIRMLFLFFIIVLFFMHVSVQHQIGTGERKHRSNISPRRETRTQARPIQGYPPSMLTQLPFSIPCSQPIMTASRRQPMALTVQTTASLESASTARSIM